MGRRKIEIQPLGDERTKTVTFVKRKAGLFKKAYELSVLCEVDMAVIIVGSDRVYEYLSVDTKELLKYYKHQSPYELKLPEDYGKYKKRHTLKAGSLVNLVGDNTTEVNADSDFDSISPEPKRQKKTASPPNIYAKNLPVNAQFVPLAASRNHVQRMQTDAPLQRPVLRVQIPSDTKSQGGSTETMSPVENILGKQDNQPRSAGALTLQPPPSFNSVRLAFGSKLRSPESRKQMPQLHVPLSKLQTLSPSTGAMPQLPLNGSANFFSSLPPPSPSGQYPPSILPTPVFNQVFNQQYMGLMGGIPGPGMNNNTSGVSLGVPNNIPQMPSLLPSGDSGNGHMGAGTEHDDGKLKPPLQHQFVKGEQTPISGLPSRYMNEIFPSPSTLYPSHDWPSGLTPYTSTMSHFFAGMPPSASGMTPHSMNASLVNTQRTLLPPGQRPVPMRGTLVLNMHTQLADNQLSRLAANAVAQPSSSEFMGQYFKKED